MWAILVTTGAHKGTSHSASVPCASLWIIYRQQRSRVTICGTRHLHLRIMLWCRSKAFGFSQPAGPLAFLPGTVGLSCTERVFVGRALSAPDGRGGAWGLATGDQAETAAEHRDHREAHQERPGGSCGAGGVDTVSCTPFWGRVGGARRVRGHCHA